jgi:hypothetical protein
MLKPFPQERMEVWPVDKRVGNVANDDPSLIVPVDPSASSAPAPKNDAPKKAPPKKDDEPRLL